MLLDPDPLFITETKLQRVSLFWSSKDCSVVKEVIRRNLTYSMEL